MNLQNVALRDREIVIVDGDTFNAIGWDVVLENCTLRCRVPAKSLSIRATLIQSLVIAEAPLVGFSWLEARLLGCTFQGVLKQNSFGGLGGSDGCCKSCAFSDADLDGGMFFGEHCESHSYPTWPHFTILDPHRNIAELRKRPRTERIADVVDSIEFFDEEVTAVTYNATSVARRLGEDIRDINSFFSQFEFVRL